MNKHKDSFTDPSQLEELNKKVWKMLGKGHAIIEKAKSDLDDTVPATPSTAVVDEAGSEPTDIPPAIG